jgi:hypothetical protein
VRQVNCLANQCHCWKNLGRSFGWNVIDKALYLAWQFVFRCSLETFRFLILNGLPDLTKVNFGIVLQNGMLLYYRMITIYIHENLAQDISEFRWPLQNTDVGGKPSRYGEGGEGKAHKVFCPPPPLALSIIPSTLTVTKLRLTDILRPALRLELLCFRRRYRHW